MKKIFCLLLLLFVIPNIFSQSHMITQNVLGWGFDVGYNASTLYNVKGNQSPLNFNHSVHAGVMVTTTMPLVNVEFGAFYSEKGGGARFNDTANITKYKLRYIEIPINLTFKIAIPSYYIKPFAFYPYVGITPGFLIKATGYPLINGAVVNTNTTKQFNWFDIGVNAGVGLEMSGFNIRLGCTTGILPVRGGNANQYRNLLFTASVGYMFYK